MKLHGTSPANPDSDSDRMGDGDEVFAGTLPTDAGSLLEASLDLIGRQLEISVGTVSGRLYTVQSIVDPISGTWQNLPGLVDQPGDGTTHSFAAGSAGASTAFRIRVGQ